MTSGMPGVQAERLGGLTRTTEDRIISGVALVGTALLVGIVTLLMFRFSGPVLTLAFVAMGAWALWYAGEQAYLKWKDDE
jgi:hypothetical protein